MADINDLISKSASPTLPLGLSTMDDLINARKALITFAPVWSEYAKAQRDIAQIAREINNDWHSQLLDMTKGARALVEARDVWKNFIEFHRPFEMYSEIDRLNANLRASLDGVSLLNSLFRQDSFIQLYTESIKMADLTRLSMDIRDAALKIQDAFLPTLATFSVLRDAWLQKPDHFEGMQIFAREHFLTTDMLHHLTVVREPELFEQERAITVKDADERMLMVLPEALSKINPDLLQLWKGAWEAFMSDNPDRIRHTLVSARELVTRVLHALSPDDQVKAWSKSAKDFDKGRPTRPARLSFIYSGINDRLMKDHCEKEIEACLCLIDLFQVGTHDILPRFSDTHLRVILRRVHSMICTLVEIHFLK